MYVGERPIGIDLSADGSRLFVSHLRSGNLSVIDRQTGELVRTVHLVPTLEAREAAELTRQGSELIVAIRPPQPATTAAVIRRLDADTLANRGEAPTGSDPGGITGSSAGDGRVMVANFEANTVSEFGPNGLEETYTVSPGPLGLRRLADGRVLVLNYYSNSISLIDPASKRVEMMGLTLDGRSYSNPTHAALSPDGRTAYIVSSGTDAHLLAFDVAAKRVVAALPIDALSFDVAVAPAPETASPWTVLSAAILGRKSQ
jgi:DNA-binding beta-propeller fold protein YncE